MAKRMISPGRPASAIARTTINHGSVTSVMSAAAASLQDPWVIEEQIDNFKRLAHPGMTAHAENGEAKP